MTLQDRIEHTNAIADAIQRNEKSYDFEAVSGSGLAWGADTISIELPTPQIVGTMVQRRSYAMSKAMDILNTLSL